jgi:citrate lyase subunit beta/citryl-CoA lyase
MSSSASNALACARSFLFVPGNRPERFGKAVASGADAVVLDIEDAVPLGDKAAARAAVRAAWPGLKALGRPLVVRINPARNALGAQDLQLLAQLDALAGVMVPKAESAQDMAMVRAALPAVPILPLIESAAGLGALAAIAGAPNVLRLVIGHIDFMADTGMQCAHGEPELAPLRFAVALATLAPAIDGVTLALHDDEQLRRDTRQSLRYGFGGKLCIHPRQVAVVHAVMAPAPEDLAWAQRVLAADAQSGGAAVQLEGRMVDLPVVLQARRLLARAALSG